MHASADGECLVLDDGTGPPVFVFVPPSCVTRSFRKRDESAKEALEKGAYVACVGTVHETSNVHGESAMPAEIRARVSSMTKARYYLRGARIQNLSLEPERESLWNVEVVEAFRVLELYHREQSTEGIDGEVRTPRAR